ncbi:MAG: VOC family protein [Steroidobacteraceae bacterium]|jgi:catechol 2,3-dioxygenase-like lactoylglutathione lyase family enzyme|nr:VOC family protein [Steroidobacteraceae bacterium]
MSTDTMSGAGPVRRVARRGPGTVIGRWPGVAARLAMLVVLLCAGHPGRAAPVPEAERIPVDLRRTTLVVRDIEKSLPLYRDALGFRVIYDEKIGPGPDEQGRPRPPSVRLVLLRANDDFIGVLGLMQRLQDPAPPPPPRFGKAQAGDAILVINVADLDTRFAKVRATPWVTVADEPERIEYPAPGGQGTIPVLFSAVWDADGNFIELNKILGTPAGQAKPAAPRGAGR